LKDHIWNQLNLGHITKQIYGHNGAISMDATFGTNDVNYHLFTLMGFDVHRTKVPLV
jgi:hypothetical protein